LGWYYLDNEKSGGAMRVLLILSMLIFPLEGLFAMSLGYEDLVLGTPKNEVLEILRDKYSKYRIEDTVDGRFGVPIIMLHLIRQGKRCEVSLEFNYRRELNHITVRIFGMNDADYTLLLRELISKLGEQKKSGSAERPAMYWTFEKKRYELEALHLGEFVQLSYSYRSGR
jgi:hypothetical protein